MQASIPCSTRQRPWGLALLLGTSAAGAAQVDIAAELARLQNDHGFAVTGADLIEEEARGRAEGEDVFRRLRLLLERFDHIIVQTPEGRVEQVLILGRANPAAAQPKTVVEIDGGAGPDEGPIELDTIRDGNQHSVQVTLEGADGKRVQRVLLIDTGADAVVLPASMIGALGLEPGDLDERQVQTANGRAKARMGRLAAVWLGGLRVADVEAAFLDDDKLGDKGLLGMSVLGRYEMTIDDAGNRLRLSRKGTPEPAVAGP